MPYPIFIDFFVTISYEKATKLDWSVICDLDRYIVYFMKVIPKDSFDAQNTLMVSIRYVFSVHLLLAQYFGKSLVFEAESFSKRGFAS